MAEPGAKAAPVCDESLSAWASHALNALGAYAAPGAEPLSKAAGAVLRRIGRDWEALAGTALRPSPCPDCPELTPSGFAFRHHAECAGHAGRRRARAITAAEQIAEEQFGIAPRALALAEDDRAEEQLDAACQERRWELALEPPAPDDSRRGRIFSAEFATAVARLERVGQGGGSGEDVRWSVAVLERLVLDWQLLRVRKRVRCPFCEFSSALDALGPHVRSCARHPAFDEAGHRERALKARLRGRLEPLVTITTNWVQAQHELATLLHAADRFLAAMPTAEDQARFRCAWENAARALMGERRGRSRRSRRGSAARRALARALAGDHATEGDFAELRAAAYRLRDHLRGRLAHAYCPACLRDGVRSMELHRHLEHCGGHPAIRHDRAVLAEEAVAHGRVPPGWLWVEPLDPASSWKLEAKRYFDEVMRALALLEDEGPASLSASDRRTLARFTADSEGLSELEDGRCPWCRAAMDADHLLDCRKHPGWRSAFPRSGGLPEGDGEPFSLVGRVQLESDELVLLLARLVEVCRSRSERGARMDSLLEETVADISSAWGRRSASHADSLLQWPDELWSDDGGSFE